MGQPPPPPGPQGPQGPYPGQPPQGPPPGYGQQPPQGPPPGYGQQPPQGPPPGYGQQPPQGMPPQGPPPGHPQGPPPGYGQQPPQGPPGQFPPQGPPPGFDPQGQPPGAPKKKTGLIIGGAVGAVVLIVAIGGVLVVANSSGEYVSMPDDCVEAVGDDAASSAFDGTAPALSGGFTEHDVESDGRYGELSCEGNSGDRSVSFNVELFDPEHPDILEDEESVRELFEGDALTDEFLEEETPQGQLTQEEHGQGMYTETLWDETSVGDQGLALAVSMGGADDDLFDMGMESFAVGAFLDGNVAGGVMISDSGDVLTTEQLFSLAEDVSAQLLTQVSSVAE
ncbi:hypothetical protein [Nocardiopsis nanhaiensis]